MNKLNSKERREFLKKSLATGVAVGGSLLWGTSEILFAKAAASGTPDLVAVKNGEPEVMCNQAITMMGGMKEFVKKG